MLSDFFDTMGTVTGVAAEAGLANEDGSVPGVGRVCSSTASRLSPAAWRASARTRPTSSPQRASATAAGPGSTSVVTGAPVPAGDRAVADRPDHPVQATAPALVLVGYLMFTQIGEIDVRDIYTGLPALMTIILMPLTFTIYIGSAPAS